MKKKIGLLLLVANVAFSQCNILTNERPDGNVIKYFNPKPILRQSQYELGASLYYNETTNKYFISLTVLLKTLNASKVEGNLSIQLKNTKQSISLNLIQSNIAQMNGRDVVIAMYEVDLKNLNLLKKYYLKSVFFKMNSKIYGSTINENSNLFINQLKCI